jgi:hypothetical protein
MPPLVPPERLLACEVLDLPDVHFIEPSFSELPDSRFNSMMERFPAEQGRLLLDEESEPLALAFLVENHGWIAGSFLFRECTGRLIQHFDAIGGDIYQEDRAVWTDAVREYYSLSIARDVSPAIEDLNPSRVTMIENLLDDLWGDASDFSCLDCACGSGLGSQVLHRRGVRTLSCDNDVALLSLGLSTGRLLPRETMCIDASFLPTYIPPVDAGLGLMFGEINAFNRDAWEQVTAGLLAVAEHAVITMGTEEEALLVQQWAGAREREATVRENPQDPIYDRWVCIIGQAPG